MFCVLRFIKRGMCVVASVSQNTSVGSVEYSPRQRTVLDIPHANVHNVIEQCSWIAYLLLPFKVSKEISSSALQTFMFVYMLRNIPTA